MSIADKLVYLDGTKERLRNSINSVLDGRSESLLQTNDEFREYADRLDISNLIYSAFGSGELGVLYITKPRALGMQVLFQDAAGTVPVTADGDPVGLLLDLSGNGLHATQSIAVRKPIYREGALGPRIVSASNSYLITAAAPELATDSEGFSVVMAARRESIAVRFSQYNSVTARRGFSTNSRTTSGENYYFAAQKNDSYATDVEAAISAPIVPHVMSGRWKGAGTANESRLNGSDWVVASEVLATTGSTTAQQIEIFSLNVGAMTSQGDFYGGLARKGYMSDQQHSAAESILTRMIGAA